MLVLVLGAAVAAAGAFYWMCTRQENIAFLPGRSSANWLVYPIPPEHKGVLQKKMEAVFTRSFSLNETPSPAILSLYAFGKGAVEINGKTIELGQGPNWKQLQQVDVAGHLRKGDNNLRVTVANAAGPPALWLSLSAGNLSLGTDSQWQSSLGGAAWEPAQLASEPKRVRPGNYAYGSERTIPSLQRKLPTLLLLACVSAAPWWLFHFAAKRWPRFGAGSWSSRHVLLVSALLWVALFWNNLGFLNKVIGFDAGHHVSYIEYLLKNKRVPLANEGFEMYQPPLYYALCAAVLGVLGVPANASSAANILPILGCVIGICQIGLVFASLRLLFPGQPRKQAVGLLCVAFLPPHLYLSQCVSNEMLAATLGSAAIYCCLRVLSQDRPSLLLYSALGVSIGAALLAKFSTVLLLPVILAVLVGRAFTRRQPPSRAALGIGVMLVACLAVSGWHYGRVWLTLGNPLVGNWDKAAADAWWQEPGYRTASSYWSFGQALVQPFRSGLHSVPDGLYSTLWGDGLYSGLSTNRPPWNHQLMAAGYLLAIVPSLAILAGAIVALVHLIRRPSAEAFLLVSLPFLIGAALIYMTLKVPSYGVAKAFYGLFAVVSFAAFAGWGADLLLSRWPKATLPVFVLLGTWALTSYLSLWIVGKSAEAQAWVGWSLVRDGKLPVGEQHFRAALNDDPHNVSAQVGLATVMARNGHVEEARKLVAQAISDHPDNGECYFALADWEENTERKIEDVRKAAELAPDHPSAWSQLAGLLTRQGSTAKAVDALKQAIRVTPFDAALHAKLALSWMLLGNTEEAARQYEVTLNLDPDNAVALADLAWMRATNRDAKLRDGAQAVALAERACALTGKQDAGCLDILAAAYAEAGQFDQAERSAQKALELTRAGGRPEDVTRMEKRLRVYQAKQPWREAGER